MVTVRVIVTLHLRVYVYVFVCVVVPALIVAVTLLITRTDGYTSPTAYVCPALSVSSCHSHVTVIVDHCQLIRPPVTSLLRNLSYHFS